MKEHEGVSDAVVLVIGLYITELHVAGHGRSLRSFVDGDDEVATRISSRISTVPQMTNLLTADVRAALTAGQLGPDVVFPPMPNPPAGYVLRTTPSRFRGVLPWDDGSSS